MEPNTQPNNFTLLLPLKQQHKKAETFNHWTIKSRSHTARTRRLDAPGTQRLINWWWWRQATLQLHIQQQQQQKLTKSRAEVNNSGSNNKTAHNGQAVKGNSRKKNLHNLLLLLLDRRLGVVLWPESTTRRIHHAGQWRCARFETLTPDSDAEWLNSATTNNNKIEKTTFDS